MPFDELSRAPLNHSSTSPETENGTVICHSRCEYTIGLSHPLTEQALNPPVFILPTRYWKCSSSALYSDRWSDRLLRHPCSRKWKPQPISPQPLTTTYFIPWSLTRSNQPRPRTCPMRSVRFSKPPKLVQRRCFDC